MHVVCRGEGVVEADLQPISSSASPHVLASMISVQVVLLSGEQLDIEIAKDACVHQLKKEVSARLSVPPIFQQLIVNNAEVHDDKLVSPCTHHLICSMDRWAHLYKKDRCSHLSNIGKLSLIHI